MAQRGVSSRAADRLATVRITDVAATAGVAPMTVSRGLDTPTRVSQKTSPRARDAIERLAGEHLVAEGNANAALDEHVIVPFRVLARDSTRACSPADWCR